MPWTVAALNKVLRPTLMHSIVTIAVNGSTSLLPTAAIPGADCCNSECVANLFQPRLLQMSRPKLLPAISASLHFNDAVPQRSRHTVAPFCCKCRRRSRCDVAATVGLYCLALITVSFSLLQVRHRLQLFQHRPHTLPTQRDVYGRHLLSDTIVASVLDLSNADHARSSTQRNVCGLA